MRIVHVVDYFHTDVGYQEYYLALAHEAVREYARAAELAQLLLTRARLHETCDCSERLAGAVVVAADTADQTDVRVGTLPAEPAVETGDARGRLVAPAGILELLRGKIERPSAVRHALAVALQDDRDRALRRRERNVLFDQLPLGGRRRGALRSGHRSDPLLACSDVRTAFAISLSQSYTEFGRLSTAR